MYISNETQYQKPSGLRTAGAIAAGITAQQTLSTAGKLATLPFANKMFALNNSVSKEEIKLIRNIYDNKALKEAKLDEKGVKILTDLPKSMKKFLSGWFKKIDSKLPANNDFLKKINKFQKVSNPYTQFCIGKNAFFMPHNWLGRKLIKGFNEMENKILIKPSKLPLAGFHEIGHAMNYNLSIVGKTLQKMRPFAMLAPIVIGAIAIFKGQKTPNEEANQGWFGKTTSFIKNNAGKLTTLSFAPILIEETMATVKGNKLASKLLNNASLAKKVAKSNWVALGTYATVAVTAGLATFLAVKLRDKIASPKPIEE